MLNILFHPFAFQYAQVTLMLFSAAAGFSRFHLFSLSGSISISLWGQAVTSEHLIKNGSYSRNGAPEVGAFRRRPPEIAGQDRSVPFRTSQQRHQAHSWQAQGNGYS
jgi:hypothetical protein